LADESCDFSVVRALRSAKHDVVAIAEIALRSEDDEVREKALSDDRILITEDKDFGQLIYVAMRRTGGVIFIRFPAGERRYLAEAAVDLVKSRGKRLVGNFTVIQPGRVRTGRNPRG
jgi:hypothetical protein